MNKLSYFIKVYEKKQLAQKSGILERQLIRLSDRHATVRSINSSREQASKQD